MGIVLYNNDLIPTSFPLLELGLTNEISSSGTGYCHLDSRYNLIVRSLEKTVIV